MTYCITPEQADELYGQGAELYMDLKAGVYTGIEEEVKRELAALSTAIRMFGPE